MSTTTIALMSDFGLKDPYVGILKGSILSVNPSVNIVDICHEIAPGDIKSGSFALRMAFPYFPEGTIFVAVIDPGVGTDRKGIAARINGRIYVGPDNGLLSWVLEDQNLEEAVELSNTDFFLPATSNTFHGRDIFAPIAANIAKGVQIADLGPVFKTPCTIEIPKVVRTERSLQGEAVYIDRFGSILTNIRRDQFESWRKAANGDSVRVNIGSTEIQTFGKTYASVPHGHPVALFGSAGVLEIAVNGFSAAESFGVALGTHISVYHLKS